MPSSTILIAGQTVENGFDTTSAATVSFALEDSSGAAVWKVECWSTDPNHDKSEAAITLNQLLKTGTITIGSGFGSWLFRSTINPGTDTEHKSTFGVFVRNAAGLRLYAPGMGSESSQAFGITSDLTEMAESIGLGGLPDPMTIGTVNVTTELNMSGPINGDDALEIHGPSAVTIDSTEGSIDIEAGEIVSIEGQEGVAISAPGATGNVTIATASGNVVISSAGVASVQGDTAARIQVTSTSAPVQIGTADGGAALPTALTVGGRPGSGTHAVDIGGRTLTMRGAQSTSLDGPSLSIGDTYATGTLPIGRSGLNEINLICTDLLHNGSPIAGGGGGTSISQGGGSVSVDSSGGITAQSESGEAANWLDADGNGLYVDGTGSVVLGGSGTTEVNGGALTFTSGDTCTVAAVGNMTLTTTGRIGIGGDSNAEISIADSTGIISIYSENAIALTGADGDAQLLLKDSGDIELGSANGSQILMGSGMDVTVGGAIEVTAGESLALQQIRPSTDILAPKIKIQAARATSFATGTTANKVGGPLVLEAGEPRTAGTDQPGPIDVYIGKGVSSSVDNGMVFYTGTEASMDYKLGHIRDQGGTWCLDAYRPMRMVTLGAHNILMTSGGSVAITASANVTLRGTNVAQLRADASNAVIHHAPITATLTSTSTETIHQMGAVSAHPQIVEGFVVVRRTTSPADSTTAVWYVRYVAWTFDATTVTFIGDLVIEPMTPAAIDEDEGVLSRDSSGLLHRLRFTAVDTTSRGVRFIGLERQ